MTEIAEKVPQAEILSQLAEEACELGHAALKLRRVLAGDNPTPVTLDEAMASIEEEIADVEVCLAELKDIRLERVERIKREKRNRWITRIRGWRKP